ncbi:MAG: c-type cytochrome [Planctomycetota bacterium]|jgi:putative heme-binding domain-containing protein
MFGHRRNQVLLSITALLCLAAFTPSACAQSLSQQLKSESVESLAKTARQKGNAVRGAIVFTQQKLNCTRCHVASNTKPIGPDLRQLNNDLTDTYLVEALLQPSKAIRKGFESVTVVTTAGKAIPGRIVEQTPEHVVLGVSTGDFRLLTLTRSDIEEIAENKASAMPDNLVDQLQTRDQFLDLVRYLMELAAADRNPANTGHSQGGQAISSELNGVVLLKEFNCSACHEDDVTATKLAEKQAPDLRRSIGRIAPEFLERFIADPQHIKPGTTMPDVMSSLTDADRKAAAEEITNFLVSLTEKPFATQSLDAEAASRGNDLFHTVGCVACHSPRDKNGVELLNESSVALGPIHEKYNLDGLIAFLKDPLEVRPSGRMPQTQLTHWEAIDVASYLLSGHGGLRGGDRFERQPSLAAKGKARFDQLGCRQCHKIDSTEVKPQSVALSKARPDQGCLSGRDGNWPKFGLTAQQRDAMQAALARKPEQHTSQDELALTLTAFRCLNCHQRGELGGVSDERNPHFQTENPNLGPQGRIPPTLTGVGAKLNPKWMRQVLVSGRTIRPYVLTRMPQFGTDNVARLVDLFQQQDQLPPVEFATVKDGKEIRKIGTEMVGTGGLNCIVCHTFQLKKAANMPAVDLTEMAERLQKTWFYHYMRNPQQLSRRTIMPSFWPGGRAMRRDILNGDRDLQIEALWQYLLDGRQARMPRGLIREPLELLATDEAVMLRRSYPGIGKRGIGVGYPNQVNLAFDAEQMRLALIWKGKFADPGGVWRSQGHGRVRPLGDSLLQFAPGPDLDDADTPWVVDESRPPHRQFKGYSLDEKMRPRFKYQFADVSVEDYSVDLLDSSTGRPFIRRTLTLKSASERRDLAFRAATGKKIERIDDGHFRVDDQLTVRVNAEHSATVVDAAEVNQLRILLDVDSAATQLTLEYNW